mmetsp:Transcript_35156/g.64326  ORF Transcript_35156/g.64326 Transcript_35156/m.64326 type:complete len:228 (-) Transcript_35156:177-860(-)
METSALRSEPKSSSRSPGPPSSSVGKLPSMAKSQLELLEFGTTTKAPNGTLTKSGPSAASGPTAATRFSRSAVGSASGAVESNSRVSLLAVAVVLEGVPRARGALNHTRTGSAPKSNSRGVEGLARSRSASNSSASCCSNHTRSCALWCSSSSCCSSCFLSSTRSANAAPPDIPASCPAAFPSRATRDSNSANCAAAAYAVVVVVVVVVVVSPSSPSSTLALTPCCC